MDVLERFLRKYSYKFDKGYPDVNNPGDIALINEILNTNFDITLSEVSLSPTQLKKPFPPRNELHGKYNDRGEKFLEKIIKGEEIELNNGDKINIDPDLSRDAITDLKNKNYNKLGGGKKIFTSTDGEKYSLSQFKKTKEFGSGSGFGGGSAQTSIQECAQSVVNTIVYNIVSGQISEEDLTPDNISKAFKMSKVNNSLEEILEFIQNKTDWTSTLVNTANSLYSKYSNKNFEQHKGSEFVDSIYKAFKIAKKDKGLSLSNDKWNPADIWMVDKSILDLSFPTNLEELNGKINDLFVDEKLIGVSLKKLGKGEPDISIYNIDDNDLEGYTYEGFDSKPTNNNVNINYSDGEIIFRTFNFATNFAGEIKGKTSAHGKIGRGAINDVLITLKLSPLPSTDSVKKGFEKKDKELINDFYKNWSIVVGETNKEEFIEIVNSKDLNYLVSKYMSTKLAQLIHSQEPKIQNEIISDIVRYASSATNNSSAFVKIS